MEIFFIVLGLACLVVAGNALVLLRTARKPKLPEGFKPKPPQEDEDQDEW